MRTQRKFEAVAIGTYAEDRRIISKSVIQTATHDQALAIASALANLDNVMATPVYRDFDVFGKCYWTNRTSD